MDNRMLVLACVAILGAAADRLAAAPDETVNVTQDNVVVLLDASGSMEEAMRRGGRAKMDVAKEALVQVLSGLPATTNVGVLVFSGRNVPDDWIYPLGPIERDRLVAAIGQPEPRGKTPLGKYLKIAGDRLLEQREAQLGYGTYRLLVVTDGEANDPALVDRYLPDILARGLVVDVVGVDMKSTHALATRVHSYRRADEPEALARAVAEVFAEVGRAGDDVAGDDQFAFMAALPDGMAAPLLAALTRVGNEPIGRGTGRDGRSAPRRDGRGAGGTPPAGTIAPAAAAPAREAPADRGRSRSPVTVFVVAVVVVMVITVLRRVTRSAGVRG